MAEAKACIELSPLAQKEKQTGKTLKLKHSKVKSQTIVASSVSFIKFGKLNRQTL